MCVQVCVITTYGASWTLSHCRACSTPGCHVVTSAGSPGRTFDCDTRGDRGDTRHGDSCKHSPSLGHGRMLCGGINIINQRSSLLVSETEH